MGRAGEGCVYERDVGEEVVVFEGIGERLGSARETLLLQVLAPQLHHARDLTESTDTAHTRDTHV